MSQRNPRFSYIHTLREIGDGGFTVNTDAFTAATPRYRLFDDQSKLLCGQTDPDLDIEFEQSPVVGPGHPNLNRILIPAGHNYGLDRQIRFELDATDIKVSDESTLERWVPSSGLIDIELDPTSNLDEAFTLKLAHWTSGTSTAPGIGELWWTQTVQPTTGNAEGWPDSFRPTVTRQPTQSGATFNHIDGEPRRFFGLTHRAVTGADLLLYDELMRRTGYGALPFWYEHPDSGDAVTLINALDDDTSTGLNFYNCSQATATGGGPDTNDCILFTSNSASTVTFEIVSSGFPGAAAIDLRNTVLQFDMKILSDVSWITSATDIRVLVQSTDPLKDPSTTDYRVSNAIYQDAIVNEWVRVQIDLEDDFYQETANSRPGVDLSNVTRMQFAFETGATAKPIELANLRYIDKTKQPVLVEVQNPDRYKRQVASGPSTMYWDIELEMLEVTT